MAIEYATWNPDDKAQYITLSNGNLDVGKIAGPWMAVRPTQGKTSGKWYVEMELLGDSRLALGYGTAESFLGTPSIHGFPGYDLAANVSWGHFMETGRSYYQRTNYAFLFVVNVTDIVRMKIDLDTGWAYHAKNDEAFDPDPVNAVQFPVDVPIFPMAGLYYLSSVVKTNFGQNAFAYDVPDGYNAGWYEGNGVTGHKRKVVQMRQLRK